MNKPPAYERVEKLLDMNSKDIDKNVYSNTNTINTMAWHKNVSSFTLTWLVLL